MQRSRTGTDRALRSLRRGCSGSCTIGIGHRSLSRRRESLRGVWEGGGCVP